MQLHLVNIMSFIAAPACHTIWKARNIYQLPYNRKK